MAKTMYLLGIIAAMIVVGFAVLRLSGAWDRILSPGQRQVVNFATLELTATPNQFLLCPPAYCPKAAAHGTSPVFEKPLAQLRDAFEKVALSAPNVIKVAEAGDTIDFIQRSTVIGWPDWITVQFIDRGESHSTLAIYSRSVYGRSDFGANRQRITRWLAALAD